MISLFVFSGKACHKHAHKPAIIGEAKEVPFPSTNESMGAQKMVFDPIEVTSGFIVGNSMLPRELNSAMILSVPIAATHKASGASEGMVM